MIICCHSQLTWYRFPNGRADGWHWPGLVIGLCIGLKKGRALKRRKPKGLNPILTVKPVFLTAFGHQEDPILTILESCEVS